MNFGIVSGETDRDVDVLMARVGAPPGWFFSSTRSKCIELVTIAAVVAKETRAKIVIRENNPRKSETNG